MDNLSTNQTFSFKPESPNLDQRYVKFEIYYTRNYDAEYCGDPGVELLGVLNIDLPGNLQLF